VPRSGLLLGRLTPSHPGQSNPVAALGPEPRSLLRPLARVLYFWPLASLGSSGASIAHLFNLILLAAAVYLLVSLTKRPRGAQSGDPRRGSSSRPWPPCPASWRGPADRRTSSRSPLAWLHFTCETRGGTSGRESRPRQRFSPRRRPPSWCRSSYSGLDYREEATASLDRRPRLWRARARLAAPPPRIRELASRGFGSEPRGYVGFANLAVSEFHARRLPSRALQRAEHVRVPPPWPDDRIVWGIVAIAIAIAGAWLAARRGVSEAQSKPPLDSARRGARGPHRGARDPPPVAHDPSMGRLLRLLPAIGKLAPPRRALVARPACSGDRRDRGVIGLGPGAARSRFRARTPLPSEPSSRRIGPFGGSRAVFGSSTRHSRAALRFWFLVRVERIAGHPRDDPRRTGGPDLVSRRDARHAAAGAAGRSPGAEFLFRVTSALDVRGDRSRPWNLIARAEGTPTRRKSARIIRTYARGLAASVNRTARYASSKGCRRTTRIAPIP